MTSEADVLLKFEESRQPLTDKCSFCQCSRRDVRHSNYKGCRFCRNSRAEFGAGPSLDGMKTCTPREWLESKEREWAARGGFSAFCKKYNLDEAMHREEADE